MKFKILLIGLLTIICSCNNLIDKELEQEIEVINEIMPSLTNYIPIYKLHPTPPLPPRPILNEYGEIIEMDTVELEKQLKIYNEAVKKIQHISTIYIALFDTLTNNSTIRIDSSFVETDDPEYSLIIRKIIDNKKEVKKIDVGKIMDFDNYSFKNLSEFPLGEEIFKKNYDFNFGGIITFSRIYFNETYSKATLYCTYDCGRNCFTGNLLFLENINNKWTIKEVRTIRMS